MTFEYKKLQLLKSSQNEVVPNTAITLEKRKTSQRYIYQANFEIKLLISQISQQFNVMFQLWKYLIRWGG